MLTSRMNSRYKCTKEGSYKDIHVHCVHGISYLECSTHIQVESEWNSKRWVDNIYGLENILIFAAVT